MATKKKTNSIIHVSDKTIEKLKEIAEQQTFTTRADLFYENQVPHVGYLIAEGKGKLQKKRRKDIPLKKGDLFGLTELLNHTASTYGAQVEEGSTIIYLDRSTIYEIFEGNLERELCHILQSFQEGA